MTAPKIERCDCGGQPIVVTWDTITFKAWCECPWCHARGPADQREREAIERHNKRMRRLKRGAEIEEQRSQT